MIASAPNVNMVPLRLASLSSFLAVVILKMPMTTNMNAAKTSTRKIRFTIVISTLTTSPGGTPRNPKIGLSVEPNARNAKSTPTNSKSEQPNAEMQPMTSFLLDFDWSFGNATATPAGFCGCAAADGAGAGAGGCVGVGLFGFGCCGIWLSIIF